MGPKLEILTSILDKIIVYLKIRRSLSQKRKRKNKMANKNAYAQSGVDVEAGYEVVERIKKFTWLVRSVQVSWELLVVLVVCLTFQNWC